MKRQWMSRRQSPDTITAAALPWAERIAKKSSRSLDVVCPKCRKAISPPEVRRADFERIECPVCGSGLRPAPDLS